MKSIKIENGDMFFKTNKLVLVEELEQKIQKTKGLLLTNLGELFFNTKIGLDFKNVLSIDKKTIDDNFKKMAIRECLAQDDNIEQINIIEIKHNVKTRLDTINLKIKYKEEGKITEIGGINFE